jgi:hypothetical protein
MKCPYRKQIKTTINGFSDKTTEIDFMECVKEECPFWGAIAISADNNEWIYGCRKAKNECL